MSGQQTTFCSSSEWTLTYQLPSLFAALLMEKKARIDREGEGEEEEDGERWSCME